MSKKNPLSQAIGISNIIVVGQMEYLVCKDFFFVRKFNSQTNFGLTGWVGGLGIWTTDMHQ